VTGELTAARLRAARTNAQLLGATRPGSVHAAVATVVAVQAQAPGPARLAIRARTTGLTAADVDRACADGSLVRTWAMRGTLHALAAADVRWVVGLFGPVFARADRRRRAQLGLDDETCARACAAIEQVLAGGQRLVRAELIERIGNLGVHVAPGTQAPPHLLAYAANQGLICRGPDVERAEPTYVLLDEYVPPTPALDEDSALAELARRYLIGRGPATAADLRAWSGLPAARVHRAFAAIADELTEVRAAGERMHVVGDVVESALAARLLGHFDGMLLGYRDRDLVLDRAFAKRVQAGGGFIQPTVLVDGRVAGTWSLERRGATAKAVVTPFAGLSRRHRDQLAGEAEDIGRFLDQDCVLDVLPDGN
jgi:hypothetical protein